MSATFKVTSGPAAFNGDLVGNASWTTRTAGRNPRQTAEKVRNVSPIKINEFASAPVANSTDSFIELYNAGDSDVDLSNWTLTEHPTQQPIFSSVKIPAGTKLAANGFYLLGLSNSGLAVPAHKGDTTIYVRSTTGMNVGDTIEIDTGSGVETRKIASVGTAAGNPHDAVATPPRRSGDHDPRRLDQRAFHRPAVAAAWRRWPAGGFAVGGRRSASATAPPIPPSRTPLRSTRWSRSPRSASRARKPGWRRDAKAGDTNIKVSARRQHFGRRQDPVGHRQRRPRDRDRHGQERRHGSRLATPSTALEAGGRARASNWPLR